MDTLTQNKKLHNPELSANRRNPVSVSNLVSPQIGYNANISSTPAKTLLIESETHEETTGNGYKRTYSYTEWRNNVTEALILCGMEKEAKLFGSCAETPLRWISSSKKILPENASTVWTCSHDDSHEAALFCATCDLRICPDCAARQTARLAARYIPKAIELAKVGGMYGLRHIVFTTPLDLTSDVPAKISAKADYYAKLVRKALARAARIGKKRGRRWETLGFIQAEEYGTNGLKLHFHVIHYGSYIPQDVLSKCWQHVTDDQASIVFVRKIGNGSDEEIASDVIETLKYSVKFHKTNNETGEVEYIPPNVMPHLLDVLKGRRRIRSYGVFYGLPKPDKQPFQCPECHADMQRIGVENWSLWLEFGATYEQVKLARNATLNSKLANKSDFFKAQGNKSPPKTGIKQAIPEQLSLAGMPDKQNEWQ